MTSSSNNQLDQATFDYVRKLVLQRAAIVLEAGKGYLVESRLTPLARQLGLAGVRELVAKMKDMPPGELHEQVVDAMTTNETSFFRDVHPFETVKTVVLPELLERRAATRSLRIWSAACSSGQEPYSIALLLREQFRQTADWDVKIFATDLSNEMLARAASGEYSQAEVNRGLPAALLVKYFDRAGLHWVIKPEIRRMVRFTRLNLLDVWGTLPSMDIVFMRNVLIYFTPDTKRQILDKVHRKLAADGTLLLGGAETTLGLHDQYDRISLGKTTIYRPAQPAAVLAAH